jgi:hypothetical protein
MPTHRCRNLLVLLDHTLILEILNSAVDQVKLPFGFLGMSVPSSSVFRTSTPWPRRHRSSFSGAAANWSPVVELGRYQRSR